MADKPFFIYDAPGADALADPREVASHWGRYAQRHDRALAERDQGEGRGALAVPPRHRRGGDVRLYVDGEQVGAGRVDATVPMLFSEDETTDVGSDSGTPVTDDLSHDQLEFNGRVRWVEIDIGEDAEDVDHLITPEERYRIAMARQ